MWKGCARTRTRTRTKERRLREHRQTHRGKRMEIDFSKVWLGGAGLLVGAIVGAWIWAQHAAATVQPALPGGDSDDALIHAVSHPRAPIAAALQRRSE